MYFPQLLYTQSMHFCRNPITIKTKSVRIASPGPVKITATGKNLVLHAIQARIQQNNKAISTTDYSL